MSETKSDLTPLLCCPHCNSENGYSYRRVESFGVTGSWGGTEVADFEHVEHETKPRCVDCNKIIRAI